MAQEKRFEELDRLFDNGVTMNALPVGLAAGTAARVFDFDNTDLTKSFEPQIDYVPFTAMQNVTGQPAMNIPLYWNRDNLPIGTQFVAPFGDELTLLKLAAQLEKSNPWFNRYAKIRV